MVSAWMVSMRFSLTETSWTNLNQQRELNILQGGNSTLHPVAAVFLIQYLTLWGCTIIPWPKEHLNLSFHTHPLGTGLSIIFSCLSLLSLCISCANTTVWPCVVKQTRGVIQTKNSDHSVCATVCVCTGVYMHACTASSREDKEIAPFEVHWPSYVI